MNRKKAIRATVAVIIIAGLIVGFKAFTAPGAPGGMPEHITIAQARASNQGQAVKVGGDVVPGSIRWDNSSGSLLFTLAGAGESMQVVYAGPAPKDFKPGLPMVVNGSYTQNGVFEATSITSRTSPLCKTCHQ